MNYDSNFEMIGVQHYIASIWNIGKLIICLTQKHYIHLVVIAPLN
jgi:hypothetical protein